LVVLHGVEVVFEGVEVVVPEFSVGGEPGVDFGQGLGAEFVPAALGVFAYGDESGFAQDAEVFGGAGLGEAEVGGEFADEAGALEEEVEDAASCGVGEGVEAHAFNILDWLYSCNGMCQGRRALAWMAWRK
jgi:hypothetical protein